MNNGLDLTPQEMLDEYFAQLVLAPDKLNQAHFELNKQLKTFKTLKHVNDALFFTPKQQETIRQEISQKKPQLNKSTMLYSERRQISLHQAELAHKNIDFGSPEQLNKSFMKQR